MPGYTIRNGRIYRTQRTTVPRTQQTEPEPEPELIIEPVEQPVEPEQPTAPEKNLPDPPKLLVDTTFEPMPQAAIQPMLQQVWPLENEIVYDLGCGDGRILIEAVKSFGCKAVGIEINPATADLAKKNVEESGLDGILVIQGNARDYDLSDANVITMYLFPDVMKEIIPNIKPGARVVSFEHEIPGTNCIKKTAKIGDTNYTYFTWVKPRDNVDYTIKAQIIPQKPTPQIKPFSLVE
jgi:SAM-dependent methyltransferase